VLWILQHFWKLYRHFTTHLSAEPDRDLAFIVQGTPLSAVKYALNDYSPHCFLFWTYLQYHELFLLSILSG